MRFATVTTDAGGAFRLDVDMGLVIGGCRSGQSPSGGTQYTIYVSMDDGRGNSGALLAIAIFTITGDKAAPVGNHTALAPAHNTTWETRVTYAPSAALPRHAYPVLISKGASA